MKYTENELKDGFTRYKPAPMPERFGIIKPDTVRNEKFNPDGHMPTKNTFEDAI